MVTSGNETERCADRYSAQFENNYFTEMCSGSEAGSCLRLIDFVYQPTLGLRVIKKKKRRFQNAVFRLGGKIGGVPREQKMLKGHLPRVIYHQVY